MRLTTLAADRVLATGLWHEVSGGRLDIYAGATLASVDAALEWHSPA